MTRPRRTPRRDDTCTARFHGREASRRHGCACPPSAGWQNIRSCRAYGRHRIQLSRSRDVDELIVDFAIAGDCPSRMTTAERLAAVTILTRRGLAAWQIAERLRCNVRTVCRYRRAGRARAGVGSC